MMAGVRLTSRRLGAEGGLYLLAGVILVGGPTAGGIIVASGSPSPAPVGQSAAPAATSSTTSPPMTSTTASSSGSTCAGWATVKSDMQGMTTLPDGWTYATPQIDILIHGRASQLTTIVSLFVDQISPEPADLAATAHAWVDAQSVEAPKLTNHTFTAADRANIDAAAHALDVACATS
jgi:hypothetical protein